MSEGKHLGVFAGVAFLIVLSAWGICDRVREYHVAQMECLEHIVILLRQSTKTQLSQGKLILELAERMDMQKEEVDGTHTDK